MKILNRLLFTILLYAVAGHLSAQGSVYLVLGSDTAIWDGLNVGNYHCTYGLGLYEDPLQNASIVMDPAFRAQFKDSYGTPMKMTWWMMAGNVYRFATNNNIPVPNTMTLHLMKKYHGGDLVANGDELSLHYHTFTWTDYNQDGTYYWNQAKTFPECREDFDVTMAQFLIEENTFPVSFRTGWHYMDDSWQNHIDGVIPYSMHDDYPAKRNSVTEPIDNVFDWSRSAKEFVPFHPSLSDYQVPGNGKSWNTRSYYMGRMNQTEMDSIFARASRGIDQVPCLWAHLPETDFPQNMKKIDSLAHVSAVKYPTVKFSYSTAVEAMQQWRKGIDVTPPAMTVTEVVSGDHVSLSISTDEEIFQTVPFVAVKDIHNNYSVLRCSSNGLNQWVTDSLIVRSEIVKFAVAVTDTMGNLATSSLNILPDDIYIDNSDAGYHEPRGAWSSITNRSWGRDARQIQLNSGDTAVAQWSTSVAKTGQYSIFFQIPLLNNPPDTLWFTILSEGIPIDTAVVAGPFQSKEWIYITTTTITQIVDTKLQMTAKGNSQTGTTVAADVVKFTAIVKDREIFTPEKIITPSPISEEDSTTFVIKIENHGVNDLTINSISAVNNAVSITASTPFNIPGMKSINIPVVVYLSSVGVVNDTIVILSNDLIVPMLKIVLQISIEAYFRIVDNEDVQHYSESGPWFTSVAQRWGASSRYAYSGSGASATFTETMKKSGTYEIFEIVPTTVNSVTNARYIIHSDVDTIGTIVIDQNIGSGDWVSIGSYDIVQDIPIHVSVIDQGPASSVVLRADAIKFQRLVPAGVNKPGQQQVMRYSLLQNFPNPFNPSTTLRYNIPERSRVSVTVYNTLGQLITIVYNGMQESGSYELPFNASQLSSGLYFYRMEAVSEQNPKSTFIETKKMVLMK